jgi:hypothetical protein
MRPHRGECQREAAGQRPVCRRRCRPLGNIRGTNEFEDHDVVIILGREQPSVKTAEGLAKAIWYDTKQPIYCIPAGPKRQVQYPYGERHYRLRDGSREPQRVRVHPDRRV